MIEGQDYKDKRQEYNNYDDRSGVTCDWCRGSTATVG